MGKQVLFSLIQRTLDSTWHKGLLFKLNESSSCTTMYIQLIGCNMGEKLMGKNKSTPTAVCLHSTKKSCYQSHGDSMYNH